MSRVSVVNHAGRNIIVTDLSSVEEESEMLEALDEVEKIATSRSEPFGTLYDVTDSYVPPVVTARAKALAEVVIGTGLSRGTATVGVNSAAKRVIGNFLKSDMYFAKDQADALAYLTTPANWNR